MNTVRSGDSRVAVPQLRPAHPAAHGAWDELREHPPPREVEPHKQLRPFQQQWPRPGVLPFGDPAVACRPADGWRPDPGGGARERIDIRASLGVVGDRYFGHAAHRRPVAGWGGRGFRRQPSSAKAVAYVVMGVLLLVVYPTP